MSTATISREPKLGAFEEYERLFEQAQHAECQLGISGCHILPTLEALAAEGECYTAFVQFMNMSNPGDKKILAIILDGYVEDITRDVLVNPRIKRYRDLVRSSLAEIEAERAANEAAEVAEG